MRRLTVTILLYQDHMTDFQSVIKKLMKLGFDGSVAPYFGPPDADGMYSVRSGLEMGSFHWRYRYIATVGDEFYSNLEQFEGLKKGEYNMLDVLFCNGIVMMQLKSENLLKFARIVLYQLRRRLILIHVPLMQEINPYLREPEPVTTSMTWHQWYEFHSYTNFHHKIEVVVELTNRVPSPEELKRWCGEPIAYIIIPIWMLKRASGVISLEYKQVSVLKALLKVTHKIILKANPSHPELRNYVDYIDRMAKELIETHNSKPLGDELYRHYSPFKSEVNGIMFEKYKYYEQAINMALDDLSIVSGENMPNVLKVLIVGAHKFYFVKLVLELIQSKRLLADIYIAETDMTFIRFLNLPNQLDKVNIFVIKKSLKDNHALPLMDLVLAEQLDSFGDNALFPEVIAMAQVHLKPTGVCIPSSCTSFISPIMSSKLFNKMRRFIDFSETPHALKSPKNEEKMFVVNPINYYEIAPKKQLFHFEFPNHNVHLNDMKNLTFESTIDSVLHGFLGSFEATLYKSVKISTKSLKTNNNFLWSYTYIPLSPPQFVPGKTNIEATFWRCVDPLRMWYEWTVSKPQMTALKNMQGASSFVYRTRNN